MDELSSIVEFSVSLKDQEQPDPLPIGQYLGVIKGAEIKISQRNTRYCAVSFFISPDQYPADFTDGNPDGMTLVFRRVGLEDNPQARWGTRRFIEAIGGVLSKKLNVTDWIGMEAALEVVHDTYEDVLRPVIARVTSAN
jgi:hypothetical protein